MVKMMVLLTKRPALTSEEFKRHWLEVHGPLVHALPGLRRYVQDHKISEFGVPGAVSIEADIDGISELWFDDLASLQRAFSSEASKALAADAALFIGRATFLVVEEKATSAAGA